MDRPYDSFFGSESYTSNSHFFGAATLETLRTFSLCNWQLDVYLWRSEFPL